MSDFITLQLANEEVDRLRAENKDLRAEIYTLNVRIEGQNSAVLRFNKETNEMSRRAIRAEDELARVKDDFDKAIEQRDRWRGGYERANAEVFRLAELLRKADPNWGSPMVLNTSSDISRYKFEQVSCSQCGGEFGPGDHGFSHCENHKHLPRLG